ncbi:hypothetical protein SERLA73DRAFT_145140 [Serpula lacrymans var. lacrymans S7.3]|uniref:Uncharacterized protein n=1 Tax=Serpula lacrymans var. lacrymans (strain S7.3) TaxID=936435 RepID=F8QD46_SERL3|nr:hypothetical protein SERLA73DRAFT_145140 [Serpula lacrymans var. lacrymans S7.3]
MIFHVDHCRYDISNTGAQTTPVAKITGPITPPTTAPTIAPIFECEELGMLVRVGIMHEVEGLGIRSAS